MLDYTEDIASCAEAIVEAATEAAGRQPRLDLKEPRPKAEVIFNKSQGWPGGAEIADEAGWLKHLAMSDVV